MKALIVSYVDGITEEIVDAIKRFDDNVEIDKVKDTLSACHYLGRQKYFERLYDVIVIDMMVQEDNGKLTKPILKPALDFLKTSKSGKFQFPNKVFALFDPDETGDRGKAEVEELGFAVSDFNFCSLQWREQLYDYLAH